MSSPPFQQLRYEDVPELPRIPHRWNDTTSEDISISTADLGTCRIRVRRYGKGRPLVLIHGLMTAGYSWRYVLEHWGDKFELVIPDLPGAGHSDYPDVYLGPDVLARSVIAMLDVMKLRGSTVIGNSMGGYICMRAAMIDPGAIGRLVNEHSPGLPTGRMIALRWATKVLPGGFIVDRLVRRDPLRWVHKNVHYFDESLKSREEHREFAVPLSSPAGRKTFYRHMKDGLDAKEMAKFGEALAKTPFPIPLLLVYADRDPVVPPIVGERLRALVPKAEWKTLVDASHFAHVDSAKQFVDAVDPFIA